MADRLSLEGMDILGKGANAPDIEWGGLKTKIKLTSVNWTRDYDHLVNWTSDAARDKFFEEREGHIHSMETGWNFKTLEVFKPGLGKHVGVIKVSLPYEIALNFNYLSVEMYKQPVPGEGETREHFFYFLTSVNKPNPNTTELFVELDTWTTYKNSIEITALQLERGHYAHALTSADSYLSNPLENHMALTEPEPDLPAVKPLVSSESLVSFQKSTPRVCIATTADLSNKDSMWLNMSSIYNIHQKTDVPTARDNWWNDGVFTPDVAFLGLNGNAPMAPVGEPTVNGGIPTVRVYSMAPNDYTAFISILRKKHPQMIKTIRAVFVLDAVLIEEGPEITSLGYSLKPVRQQSSYKLLETIGLSKDMFGYGEDASDYAKLYTSQFANIEISNIDGRVAEVSIEEIAGSLEVHARSSSAFPFLKLEAFINGIGGSAKKSYAVKPWDSVNATMFQSQWEDFKFELDIPTFGVFVDAHEDSGPAAQADIWNAMQSNYASNEIDTANVQIENDLGIVNTNKDFTTASESVANEYANTISSIGRALTNATDGINKDFTSTSESLVKDYSNAVDVSASDKIISDGSAELRSDIATDTTSTQYDNEIVKLGTDTANSLRANSTTEDLAIRSAETVQRITAYNLRQELELYSVNQAITSTSAKLNIYQMFKNAQIGVAAGALNTIGSAIGGANPISAVGSSVSAVVEIEVAERQLEINAMSLSNQTNLANSSAPVEIAVSSDGFDVTYNGDSLNYANMTFTQDVGENANSEIYDLSTANARDQAASEVLNITDANATSAGIYTVSRDLGLRIAASSLTWDLSVNTQKNSVNVAVASRSKTVGDVIAARSKTVGTAIATRNNTVDKAIAVKNQTLGNAIAARNKNVSLSNIDAVYKNKISNLSTRYSSTLKSITAGYYKTLQSAPTEYGNSAGNAWVDSWGQRGLDVRVRRCSKSIEKMAASLFSRYGYRTGALWIDEPELNVMTDFSYWKAEEVWIAGDLVNETNKEMIRAMFKDGVSIWNDPDLVCNADITNNKPRRI